MLLYGNSHICVHVYVYTCLLFSEVPSFLGLSVSSLFLVSNLNPRVGIHECKHAELTQDTEFSILP